MDISPAVGNGVTSPQNDVDLRTRSLPRPKTKALSSSKEHKRPSTPPLSQPSATEAAIVDIDIGPTPEESAKRPDTLMSCSVDTQATCNQEDKKTQVPSPQDKNTQVPSPQEKVTSSTQAPSPENVLNKDRSAQTSAPIQVSSTDVSSATLSSPESDKSQTLPRPKPSKPESAFQPSRTMTLNRNPRPKSQVVSVTIGSWQQRQPAVPDLESSSSVASTRSKFLSLENIPQSAAKPPAPAVVMEKRKLPPVPIEADVIDTSVPATVPKSVEAAALSHPKPDTLTKSKVNEYTDKKPLKVDPKPARTVPKQADDTTLKQKLEIRMASKEPTATFKSGKPFVKLTSMKDDHGPSIVGLKKWPLSDMAEVDGKQTLLDDLKASSKRPGGVVHDKIRRAEVDLRKPKTSKPEPAKAESAESKLHITKVNLTAKPSSNSSAHKSSTLPKSQSLNTELMSVFSKKLRQQQQKETSVKSPVTVNGSVTSAVPPPPPPPLPVQQTTSTMPAIPPAESIPVSSQLLMARGSKTLPARKDSKKSPTKASRNSSSDPREELMLEIRGFGGKQALRKAPSAQSGFHLRVFGTASTAANT